MRNYFKEISYNQLDIVSHFFPNNNGTTVLSYQDPHNRGYYCAYSGSNQSGYTNPTERMAREEALLYNAINYVKSEIEQANLDLDYNNDGYVDNICFMIQGHMDSSRDAILWAHWTILSSQVYINGKRAYQYNIQLEKSIKYTYGVLCHEMGHSLGAPDLYHYSDNMVPVGDWDIMAFGNMIVPVHQGAYMKYKYGGWIESIPSITAFGTYTLQPLTSSTNNCYKIPISGSSQCFVVEYRKKTGRFESVLPGSGLVIYRINEAYTGNTWGAGAGGVSDEVYIFRPDGTTSVNGNIRSAHFSETAGRTMFSNSTNPYCFTAPDGDPGNIYIKNIRENPDGTLSFDFVRDCDGDDITYSDTNNLPSLTNASNSIQTSGAVIVKSTDNVTFEARNGVVLNAGFEVQPGATFEMNIKECGE